MVIQFEPTKTCNQFKSCWECLTHEKDFNCVWCPSLNVCSDNGLDESYQVPKIKLDLYYRPEKNSVGKLKKSRCKGPEIFLRFETDLNFSRPWFSEIKVQIKRPSDISNKRILKCPLKVPKTQFSSDTQSFSNQFCLKKGTSDYCLS